MMVQILKSLVSKKKQPVEEERKKEILTLITVAILYERLITVDNATLLVGPNLPPPQIRGIAALANTYKIPMIDPNPAFRSSLKTMTNPWTFHMFPSADSVADACAEVFAQKGIKTAIVAFPVRSETRAAAANASLTAANITILATYTLPESTDLQAQRALIQTWKNLKPDLWVGQYTDSSQASSEFLLQMRREKFTPSAFYHYTMPNDPVFVSSAGWAGVHGFASSAWSPNLNFPDPIYNNSVDFANEFIRRYNTSLTGLDASAAAAGVLYWYALQDAGSLNRDAIRQALLKADYVTAFGRIRFYDNGTTTGIWRCMQEQPDHTLAPVWPPDSLLNLSKVVYPGIPLVPPGFFRGPDYRLRNGLIIGGSILFVLSMLVFVGFLTMRYKWHIIFVPKQKNGTDEWY
jgi:ABC-type branched-subunit amino acid transport system substrate-binding protein